MRFRGSEWSVTQWGLMAEQRARERHDECHIDRRHLLKAAALAAGAATMSIGQSRAAVKSHDALALTATGAVAAIRHGDITAEAYARALLSRAEAFKHLNAYITLNRSGLLAAARAVDVERLKGGQLGRLAGLPLLVKDNIDTKGIPTTAGTRGLADKAEATGASAHAVARRWCRRD